MNKSETIEYVKAEERNVPYEVWEFTPLDRACLKMFVSENKQPFMPAQISILENRYPASKIINTISDTVTVIGQIISPAGAVPSISGFIRDNKVFGKKLAAVELAISMLMMPLRKKKSRARPPAISGVLRRVEKVNVIVAINIVKITRLIVDRTDPPRSA